MIKYGAVVLPTILILGSILVLIALTGIFLAYILNLNNYGIRLSAQALSRARAGIADAELKLVRNKDYPASSYSLNLDGDLVTVGVARLCDDDPTSCPGMIENQITSTAAVGKKNRQVREVILVNKLTGELKTKSVIEIPL